jgi:hypothetical protein
MLLSIHHPYLMANTFLICLPISFAFIDYRREQPRPLFMAAGRGHTRLVP